jgi:hypothetical protein
MTIDMSLCPHRYNSLNHGSFLAVNFSGPAVQGIYSMQELRV